MKFFFVLAALSYLPVVSWANLEVSILEQKGSENKGMVTMRIKNDFDQGIKGARVWVFLMDEKGKVVGNKAQWLIGGTEENTKKNPEGLEMGKTQEYSMVVDTQKQFTKTKVTMSRLILADGTSVDPRKHLKSPK